MAGPVAGLGNPGQQHPRVDRRLRRGVSVRVVRPQPRVYCFGLEELSLRATVRLKTGAPGWLSLGSAQK